MIYYDNAATTKVYPECVDILKHFNSEEFFNPSALYMKSSVIKVMIDNTREEIAKHLKGDGTLYFTSSGSESDNTAIFCSKKAKGTKVVISEGEHDAIYNSAQELKNRGYEIVLAPINTDGTVNLEKLENILDEDVSLVSIMHVSNETGGINDLKKISNIIKRKCKNAIFHSDGVQAFGKVNVNLRDMGVDVYSISGHKIHAPKGVGGLWIRKGVSVKPLIYGGGQEYGMRSSTENVASILAFKEATRQIYSNFDKNNSTKQEIKEYLAKYLTENVENTVVLSPLDGVSHILTLAFKDLRGEVLLHAVEREGILIGVGSACSSHKESRFKKLLKLDERHKDGIVRLSFSEFNTLEEAKVAGEKIATLANKWNKFLRV